MLPQAQTVISTVLSHFEDQPQKDEIFLQIPEIQGVKPVAYLWHFSVCMVTRMLNKKRSRLIHAAALMAAAVFFVCVSNSSTLAATPNAQQPNSCTPTPIQAGPGYVGALSETDCFSDSRYYQSYQFVGEPGVEVVVNMYSDNFVSLLSVYGPNGELIEADSGSGEGSNRNSRVTFIPYSAEPFEIRASSHKQHFTGGDFAIFVGLSDCESDDLEIGKWVARKLRGCPEMVGLAQFYHFEGIAGRSVAITMNSVEFNAALTLIAPNGQSVFDDNGGGGTNARIVQTLTQTGTYIIAAQSAHLSSTGGRYTIMLLPKTENDDFANAAQLKGAAGEVRGYTFDATRQAGEPAHAGVAGVNSVWYRWRAPREGTFAFTLGGSSFDTLLAIYTGTGFSGLVRVAANDNISNTSYSRVTFAATVGTDYWIAVDGRAGAAGSGAFTLIYHPADLPAGITVTGRLPISGVTVVARSLNGTVLNSVLFANENYSIAVPKGINDFTLTVFDDTQSYGSQRFAGQKQNTVYNFLSDSGGAIVVVGSTLGLSSAADLAVMVTSANLAGPQRCSVGTMSNGTVVYGCPGLPKYATYTVTPSHPTIKFTPVSKVFVNLQSNIQNSNFVGDTGSNFRITGKVTRNGTPMKGVGIYRGTDVFNLEQLAETDANGNYTIANLPGSSFVLSARVAGFTFDGPLSISGLNSDTTANFTAGPSACSYSMSDKQLDVTSAGGFFTLSISTASGCVWEGRSSSPGVTVTSPLTNGSGTLGFYVERNRRGPRTVLVTVAGQAISITQAGMAAFDFDGDSRADVSVFRPGESTWYFDLSRGGYESRSFGVAGDILVPADFDGDGTADLAVWRPTDGNWYIVDSENGSFSGTSWGVPGDIPVPADYNGDGKSDLAVFRPANGVWYVYFGSGFTATQFGSSGDIPQPGDFDGDGIADQAVYRPSTGTWQMAGSMGPVTQVNWGIAGDVPVSGDFDGDGRKDPAVFRPATGEWFVLKSTGGIYSTHWGEPGDLVSPGDYDGDGRIDPTVFRPSTGAWWVLRSAGGILQRHFGQSGDMPVPGTISN
ncbi:MAG: FG-GAP-like repeat-containing protein [Acidobacteriota bacterium]